LSGRAVKKRKAAAVRGEVEDQKKKKNDKITDQPVHSDRSHWLLDSNDKQKTTPAKLFEQ
jgi:hypothetical protein